MVVGLAALALAGPALAAQLLPENFFDQIPATNAGQAGVEADELHYDSDLGIITASGNVGLSYIGYFATADRMVFNQKTRELLLEGNVHIVDPGGIEYTADTATITDEFKDAVLSAMVMVTPDGAMVTGSETRKVRGETTEIDDGVYAPCGTCIDAKGRRIGWRVRTHKMVQNTKEGYTELEQPILEILGLPVAWLPWLRMPDLTVSVETGFSTPTYTYTETIGHKVATTYTLPLDAGKSLVFMPALVSEQGLLMGASFLHDIAGFGAYSVTGHGIYQLDPSKFAPGFGNEAWRGALQTSGAFTPIEKWSAGWSYTTFTDPAFLTDYLISTPNPTTNEVYARYLTAETYFDARAQEFRLLGDVSQATQDQQAALLPKITADHVVDLGTNGTVTMSGDLVGVARNADHVASNAIPYRLGTKGFKTHATAEVDWSRQFLFGPAVVTPMAGLRLDYASYDGASTLQPTAATLFSATPIAAIDMRVPFVAYDGGNTQLIEPVAQAYYRGGPAEPGITNDNAQSFVFDESNLFTYNKFSGTDRQDTGLRANVGVHYLANFADGSYLDAVLGQTFQLAGANSLATPDAVNAGTGAGLDRASSDLVAGLRLGMGPVSLSGKARLDPTQQGIVAAGSINATYTASDWSVGLDYSYMAPDPARGFSGIQQDIGGSLSIALADYWSANAALAWDITAGKMISYSAGIGYDDGYVEGRASITSSGPLIYDPQTFVYKVGFFLKGPGGVRLGYEGMPFELK
ncbi:MAG: LPS assembly protein LptD [Alphaproteobacteria bacterium]|nr:LPS assembly protein LptD [Alphaproteobacteria bacterium]